MTKFEPRVLCHSTKLCTGHKLSGFLVHKKFHVHYILDVHMEKWEFQYFIIKILNARWHKDVHGWIVTKFSCLNSFEVILNLSLIPCMNVEWDEQSESRLVNFSIKSSWLKALKMIFSHSFWKRWQRTWSQPFLGHNQEGAFAWWKTPLGCGHFFP